MGSCASAVSTRAGACFLYHKTGVNTVSLSWQTQTIPNYSLIFKTAFLLYHVGMADKTNERAKIFDECLAELSPSAQREIEGLLEYVASQLAAGGGIKSAKELILQTIRFLG